jgi:hypothetical protein
MEMTEYSAYGLAENHTSSDFMKKIKILYVLLKILDEINTVGLLLQKKEANLMMAMVVTKICTLQLLKEIIFIDLKTKQTKWLLNTVYQIGLKQTELKLKSI